MEISWLMVVSSILGTIAFVFSKWKRDEKVSVAIIGKLVFGFGTGIFFGEPLSKFLSSKGINVTVLGGVFLAAYAAPLFAKIGDSKLKEWTKSKEDDNG
jgi:predicted membrane channel-forming protein YqfA (hemolysin III family)